MNSPKMQSAISAIEQADLLLMSMKGQMQIARDYAERNGGQPEFNDGLHIAIIMQTMIDSVRAILDDAAQIVLADATANP